MDSSSLAEQLGSGRAVEGGGTRGLPRAEGDDGVRVEVSAMVPLWSLLQRVRREGGAEFGAWL